jgi:hypothetical protein
MAVVLIHIKKEKKIWVHVVYNTVDCDSLFDDGLDLSDLPNAEGIS